MMTVSFCINGQDIQVEATPTDRLSDVIRSQLGLTGTKTGCDAGDCGACTVMIDGDVACGCLTAIGQVDGCSVTTVEGLAASDVLSPLQDAFLRHGAAQCGICTPGMLVAASALLAANPSPSKQEVKDALGGVLCRCTGYRKIIAAVLDTGNAAGPMAPKTVGESVGAPVPRLDGTVKVTGQDSFGADHWPDDFALVRAVRSPHHHAEFELGDVDSYRSEHPGVLAILTADDIPGVNCHGVIGPFADQPVFAERRVLFRGEAVAAVVGEPDAIRCLDMSEFPVSWTPLPAVLKPGDATADDAPQLHTGRGHNLLTTGYVERGDIAKGFAEAAHIVEGQFSTPFIEHAYIEPEAGYAIRRGDRIEIHGCTQSPYMNREAVAGVMGLDDEAIRIIPSACGGGFGSKLDLSVQPCIALAAWTLNRPAAMAYTRSESMQSTTKRHPSDISIRVGCDDGGKIMAVEFDGTFNTGAYASWGPTVASRVPVHASGPYLTPNYVARTKAVLTHCPPSGAFRGFGVPQSLIALECAYDELAERVGIDRLGFRLANALRDGQPTVTGQIFETGVGIVECLEALKPAWERAAANAAEHNEGANGAGIKRGVGVATCWYGCGNTALPNPSTIRIGVTANGRVVLHQGAVDIGQGSNTVIAQMAADALGVPVDVFELVGGDTDLTPDAGKTSASRQTYVTGSAAKKAGEALRAEILRHANVAETAELQFRNGRVELADNGNQSLIDLSKRPVDPLGYVFVAEETYDPPTTPLDEMGQGNPYAVYGYGAQLVELTVDMALGTVKLERITAAHDVGKAINPTLVEGQLEGGVAQGIGLALMEDYIPGKTENLHDYLIPTFGDVPEIETIIVEVADQEGPYGAKGLGEHVLIPTAPAILNAIHHATGVWVRDLPATPDKVHAAIQEARSHD